MPDSNLVDTGPHDFPAGAGEVPQPPSLTDMVQVDFGALTHVGKVRTNNEDHYLVGRLGRSIEPLMTNVPADELPGRLAEYGYAMLVADGMGGAAAGEVASRMAISLLLSVVADTAKYMRRRIDEAEARAVMDRLVGYYDKIHSALAQQAEADSALHGMGTTLTVAYSFCSDLFVAHVGDSRAYLFRQGRLHQLTRDQTLAQELADRGEIPPEAVARHRFKHVLTNVLGGRSDRLETQILQFRLANLDRLLLCSDGLTDMVDDASIAEVLRRTEDSNGACRELVDLALAAGGRDNITVLLAGYSFL
jgi:protein phosphatase